MARWVRPIAVVFSRAAIVAALVAFTAPSPAVARPQALDTMAVAVTARSLAMFDTEAAAQDHCPQDVVVWLNTASGIYHEKGMRWYGKTRQGAFVCRTEANAAGYRDTRNGQ